MITPLRRARLICGYDQTRFAEKVHTTQSHLSAMELGKKKPSAALALVIAEALGEKPETIFPDGCAVRPHHYKTQERALAEARQYQPEPARPVAYYTTCPRCGAQMIYATCYACARSMEARA